VLTYKKSKSGNQITIGLSNDVGIEQAVKVHENLLNAFNEDSSLIINLEKLTYMHLTIIQLITSAFKEAKKTNKKISLKGIAHAPLKTVLENAGMVYFNGVVAENEKNSFWVTGVM